MSTTTTRKPTTANAAMTAIQNRAARKFKGASALIEYTTADRHPLTGPCRVVVAVVKGIGRDTQVHRPIWCGPVAVGCDAAGVAAWERVFGA